MDWKKVGWRLLRPPGWIVFLLTVLSTGALVGVFVEGLEETPAAYCVYVMAFYTLVTLCTTCVMVLPGRYRGVKNRVYETDLGNKYMTDVAFKTHVSLYWSLAVNLLYVAVNMLSYYLYRSMWFVILAVYYGTLAIMRFLLLRFVDWDRIGENPVGEWKKTRICGCILLNVNFALSGAVLMILYLDRGFRYHGIMIYVMALYTFYMIIHAIVDIVKYRKHESPILVTAKVITLSAALVSMLSLETAMLSQFGGEMAAEDKWIMIAATGAFVSFAVLAMSVSMIRRSTLEIRRTANRKSPKVK